MPSFKDFEKVLPVSGSEGSKLSANPMTDMSESLKKTAFDTALEKAAPQKAPPSPETIPPVQPEVSKQVSPMALATAMTSDAIKAVPTVQEISAQATTIQQKMRTNEESLKKVQSLFVTPEQGEQMNASIQHIDQGLQDVSNITRRVEVRSSQPIKPITAIDDTPPHVRFLRFLTESDRKLDNFLGELGGLQIGKQRLTPDLMLAVQVKLGFITQQLDFFTSVLSKALESTKTVMNVQI